MQATLLQNDAARGDRKRLVFTQEHNGVTFGPFVEHRPEAENVDTFMAAHGEALLVSLEAVSEPVPDPLAEAVVLLKKHQAGMKDAEIDAFLAKVGA